MAKMGELGQMLDFMWQGNQNQGSSLQQKWWVVSRRTNRDQKLSRCWVSRFPLCSSTCFDFTSFQDLAKQLQLQQYHQLQRQLHRHLQQHLQLQLQHHRTYYVRYHFWMADLLFSIHVSHSSVNGFKGCGSVDDGKLLANQSTFWELLCTFRFRCHSLNRNLTEKIKKWLNNSCEMPEYFRWYRDIE